MTGGKLQSISDRKLKVIFFAHEKSFGVESTGQTVNVCRASHFFDLKGFLVKMKVLGFSESFCIFFKFFYSASCLYKIISTFGIETKKLTRSVELIMSYKTTASPNAIFYKLGAAVQFAVL